MRITPAHVEAIKTAMGIAFDDELDEVQQKYSDLADELLKLLRIVVGESEEAPEVQVQILRDLKYQVGKRWLHEALQYDARR